MKVSVRLFSYAGSLALLLFAGCAQTSDGGRTASGPGYTDPTKIEILSAAPGRPYTVLGEITLTEGDRRDEQIAETKLRTQAARLRADAVLLSGRRGSPNPQAIRYTGNTPPTGPVSAAVPSTDQAPAESRIGHGSFPDGPRVPQ